MSDPLGVLVLCGPCSDQLQRDEEGIFIWLEAKYGPLANMDGDMAVLVASRFQDLKDPLATDLKHHRCEHCGIKVYSAPTSDWLLEIKTRLEAKAPGTATRP